MFVANLEEWRKENSLERFTLLGKSNSLPTPIMTIDIIALVHC